MIQVGTPQPATAPTTGSNPTISSMKIIASETTKPITLDFEIDEAKTPVAQAAPASSSEPR